MTIRTDKSMTLSDEQQIRWIADQVYRRFSRGIEEGRHATFTIQRTAEEQAFKVFIAIYPHHGKPKGVTFKLPYSIHQTIPDVRGFICKAASECWYQYHYVKETN